MYLFVILNWIEIRNNLRNLVFWKVYPKHLNNKSVFINIILLYLSLIDKKIFLLESNIHVYELITKLYVTKKIIWCCNNIDK